MTLPEGADPSATYIEAIAPSVLKKYRVRQVYGSRRRAGWPFGREVPALAVVGRRESQKTSRTLRIRVRGPDLHQLNLIKSLRRYCRGSVGFAQTGRNETTTPLRRVAFGSWSICIPGTTSVKPTVSFPTSGDDSPSLPGEGFDRAKAVTLRRTQARLSTPSVAVQLLVPRGWCPRF